MSNSFIYAEQVKIYCPCYFSKSQFKTKQISPKYT